MAESVTCEILKILSDKYLFNNIPENFDDIEDDYLINIYIRLLKTYDCEFDIPQLEDCDGEANLKHIYRFIRHLEFGYLVNKSKCLLEKKKASRIILKLHDEIFKKHGRALPQHVRMDIDKRLVGLVMKKEMQNKQYKCKLAEKKNFKTAKECPVKPFLTQDEWIKSNNDAKHTDKDVPISDKPFAIPRGRQIPRTPLKIVPNISKNNDLPISETIDNFIPKDPIEDILNDGHLNYKTPLKSSFDNKLKGKTFRTGADPNKLKTTRAVGSVKLSKAVSDKLKTTRAVDSIKLSKAVCDKLKTGSADETSSSNTLHNDTRKDNIAPANDNLSPDYFDVINLNVLPPNDFTICPPPDEFMDLLSSDKESNIQLTDNDSIIKETSFGGCVSEAPRLISLSPLNYSNSSLSNSLFTCTPPHLFMDTPFCEKEHAINNDYASNVSENDALDIAEKRLVKESTSQSDKINVDFKEKISDKVNQINSSNKENILDVKSRGGVSSPKETIKTSIQLDDATFNSSPKETIKTSIQLGADDATFNSSPKETIKTSIQLGADEATFNSSPKETSIQLDADGTIKELSNAFVKLKYENEKRTFIQNQTELCSATKENNDVDHKKRLSSESTALILNSMDTNDSLDKSTIIKSVKENNCLLVKKISDDNIVALKKERGIKTLIKKTRISEDATLVTKIDYSKPQKNIFPKGHELPRTPPSGDLSFTSLSATLNNTLNQSDVFVQIYLNEKDIKHLKNGSNDKAIPENGANDKAIPAETEPMENKLNESINTSEQKLQLPTNLFATDENTSLYNDSLSIFPTKKKLTTKEDDICEQNANQETNIYYEIEEESNNKRRKEVGQYCHVIQTNRGLKNKNRPTPTHFTSSRDGSLPHKEISPSTENSTEYKIDRNNDGGDNLNEGSKAEHVGKRTRYTNKNIKYVDNDVIEEISQPANKTLSNNIDGKILRNRRNKYCKNSDDINKNDKIEIRGINSGSRKNGYLQNINQDLGEILVSSNEHDDNSQDKDEHCKEDLKDRTKVRSKNSGSRKKANSEIPASDTLEIAVNKDDENSRDKDEHCKEDLKDRMKVRSKNSGSRKKENSEIPASDALEIPVNKDDEISQDKVEGYKEDLKDRTKVRSKYSGSRKKENSEIRTSDALEIAVNKDDENSQDKVEHYKEDLKDRMKVRSKNSGSRKKANSEIPASDTLEIALNKDDENSRDKDEHCKEDLKDRMKVRSKNSGSRKKENSEIPASDALEIPVNKDDVNSQLKVENYKEDLKDRKKVRSKNSGNRKMENSEILASDALEIAVNKDDQNSENVKMKDFAATIKIRGSNPSIRKKDEDKIKVISEEITNKKTQKGTHKLRDRNLRNCNKVDLKNSEDRPLVDSKINVRGKNSSNEKILDKNSINNDVEKLQKLNTLQNVDLKDNNPKTEDKKIKKLNKKISNIELSELPDVGNLYISKRGIKTLSNNLFYTTEENNHSKEIKNSQPSTDENISVETEAFKKSSHTEETKQKRKYVRKTNSVKPDSKEQKTKVRKSKNEDNSKKNGTDKNDVENLCEEVNKINLKENQTRSPLQNINTRPSRTCKVKASKAISKAMNDSLY